MSTDAYRKCSKCGAIPAEEGIAAYHRFPKPGKTNIERARAWARFCWPEQDWQSIEALTKLYKSNKVLCKRHFKENCFTDSSKKHLGKFSIPTENFSVATAVPQCDPGPSFTTPQRPSDPGPSFTTLQTSSSLGPTFTTPQRPSDPEPSCTTEATLLPVVDSSKEHYINKTQKKSKSRGILADLGVKKIKELTPRENHIYKICKKNLKEIQRLRSQLKKKKNVNEIENLMNNENVKKLYNLNLSNSFIVLLQNQIQNCKRQKKGRRYTIDQKIMALTLYKKSPACYRLLRRLFTLPCQSIIKKLLGKIPLNTGINNHIFKSLKRIAEQQIDEDNIAILSFDEMAIRKNLHYNIKDDIIEGFQDHGNQGRTNQIASNALVFMLAGVRKKWKQPISFYFSGKSVTADRLSVIIKEILRECFKTGLKVIATVCDLSTVNIKALEILGSTKENPYFKVECEEIVTILDPPHLLKCTRNLFLSHDIEITTHVHVDGKAVKGIAKWSHVEEFYNLDQKKDSEDMDKPKFVFAPALTDQHIRPNSKQKMRVKLAAQIFSHTVTAGILTKIATNELPAEAHATATLLSKFDELFDALNADTPDLKDGKKFSTNMSSKSAHLNLFQEMKIFITQMKFLGSNSCPPSQLGWIRTINAVERVWKNIQALGVKTLSTRRLNQDPLENCFGCIRYHCGSNDNPNIAQFISGIKTAIINNLRHSGINKNCEDDDAVLTDNLKSFLLENEVAENVFCDTAINESNSTTIEFDSIIAEACDALEQASPEAQACAYVCGFIYKKIKNIGCNNCRKLFLIAENENIDNIHLFTSFKEYDVHKHLKYVNKSFVQCVEICSSAIYEILNKEAYRRGIKSHIIDSLNQLDFNFLNDCSMHYLENKNHIMHSTFFICIRRYTVLKNRTFLEDDHKKALQKKVKILKNM